VPLTPGSVKGFADNVCRVVSALKKLEICAGADLVEMEDLWAVDKQGKIDENIFDKSRYDKTFRSHECSLLVPVRRWRCKG